MVFEKGILAVLFLEISYSWKPITFLDNLLGKSMGVTFGGDQGKFYF
jgi:hypothetical protein